MASDHGPRLALADAVLVAITEDNKGTVCAAAFCFKWKRRLRVSSNVFCLLLSRRLPAPPTSLPACTSLHRELMIVFDGLFVVVALHHSESLCVTHFQHKYKCAKWVHRHTHKSFFESCRYSFNVRVQKAINS